MRTDISPVNWYDYLPQTHPIGETFEDGFRKGFLKAQEVFTKGMPEPNRDAWNQTQEAHDGKMYPPDAERAMENIENAIFDVPWKFKPDWSADEWIRCLRGIVTDRGAEIARLTAALREIYQMAEYAIDEPHLDAERVRDISRLLLNRRNEAMERKRMDSVRGQESVEQRLVEEFCKRCNGYGSYTITYPYSESVTIQCEKCGGTKVRLTYDELRTQLTAAQQQVAEWRDKIRTTGFDGACEIVEAYSALKQQVTQLRAALDIVEDVATYGECQCDKERDKQTGDLYQPCVVCRARALRGKE